jgi:aryl-alcohol dehydrogenase-like predicted oxidoreductase
MTGSRLGLGTAQFGLDYGITNQAGQVPQQEVRAILRAAEEAGINMLDTAHLYGESEEAIGRCAGANSFSIVTKTPKFQGQAADRAAAQLRTAFQASLDKLGRQHVRGLLFHDAGDLLGPLGPSLWEEMRRMKAADRVERIGVSVYEGAEIDAVLDRFAVDIVQLPWNPVDNRLETGRQLEKLAAAGVEVHARSLFLQGLLLQPAEKIPDCFAPIREAVVDLDRRFAAAGLGRLEGILAAAFERREITRFVVGVTSAEELRAISLAALRAEGVDARLEIPAYRGLDACYLNPARWAELR